MLEDPEPPFILTVGTSGGGRGELRVQNENRHINLFLLLSNHSGQG